MKPRRILPRLARPLFFTSRRPYAIRSVLLSVALGLAMSALLAHWAELQGGPLP